MLKSYVILSVNVAAFLGYVDNMRLVSPYFCTCRPSFIFLHFSIPVFACILLQLYVRIASSIIIRSLKN